MSSKEYIKQSFTQNSKTTKDRNIIKIKAELNRRNKADDLLKLPKKTQHVNSLKKIKINRSIIAISLKEKNDKNNNNKKPKIKVSNSNKKFNIANILNSKKQISYRNKDFLSNRKNPYQSAYVLNKSNLEKSSFNKIIKSIKLGLNNKNKNKINNFKPNSNINDYHKSVNTISNVNKKNKKGYNNSINLVTDYNNSHKKTKNNNRNNNKIYDSINQISEDQKDIRLNTQRNCSYNNSLIKLSSLKVNTDNKDKNNNKEEEKEKDKIKIDNYIGEKQNNSINGKFNLSFTEVKSQNDNHSLAIIKEANAINKKDVLNNNYNTNNNKKFYRNMNQRRLIFQKMNLTKINNKNKMEILNKLNNNELDKRKKRINLSCSNNLRNMNKSLKLSTEELKIDKNNEKNNNINTNDNNNQNNNISLSSNSEQNTDNVFNGKIENYHMSKELGKGSYASVKLATHILTKNKYAIKMYTKCSLLSKQKKNTVKNEINILKQLDHVNIMKLYEVIDTEKYLYLVLEYIKGCSLLDLVKKEHDHVLKEKRAINIFHQVVQGIAYCHSKNICHRDIKLENILVKNNDEVKIIDFGFAIKNDTNTYNKLLCGTPSYMSPEIVNKKKYIAQYSEVWTLGVLLFVMLYGRFPFKGKNEEDLFMKIKEGDLCLPEDKFVSSKVKKLLEKILVVDPKKRPTAQDIDNYLQLYVL